MNPNISRKQSRNIYVGLDELFDTRLGLLNQLDPDNVAHALDAGYYQRERDCFPGYPYEQWRQLYDQRTPLVLRYCIRSYIVDMVIEALFKLHMEMINEPFRGLPVVTINTHPYNISNEEQDELSLYIQAHAGEDLPLVIDYVNIAPVDLSPKFAGSTYCMMFMYDYLQWMEIHGEALEDSLMAQIEVIGPGLFLDQEPVGEQVIDEASGIKIHPFEGLRLLARRLINLRIIPVKYFSAVSPENTLDDLNKKEPEPQELTDELLKEMVEHNKQNSE